MNANLIREIKALRSIGEINKAPLWDGYISAYRAYRGDDLLLYVYVDAYQLLRDHRGLPDLIKGLGKNNWNVDQWEERRHVVFWGHVQSRKQFRQVMVVAKKALSDIRTTAQKCYPKGRREWVVRTWPSKPLVKDMAERKVHRSQRLLRGLNHG